MSNTMKTAIERALPYSLLHADKIKHVREYFEQTTGVPVDQNLFVIAKEDRLLPKQTALLRKGKLPLSWKFIRPTGPS